LSALQHLTITNTNTALRINNLRTLRCKKQVLCTNPINIRTDATIDEIDIWCDRFDEIQLRSIHKIARGSIHVRDVDMIFSNYFSDNIPSQFELYKYEGDADTYRITRLENRRFLVHPIV
jgi:hypothetical protein